MNIMENQFQNYDTVCNKTDIKLLIIVLCLFVAVFSPTILWLFQRWTMSVWHNGHGLLITAAVCYLVWQETKKNQEIKPQASSLGFVILLPALVLHMLDTGLNTQLLSAFALFLSLPGLSLLFLGKKQTKNISFPLSMLLFTLPIPLAFTESLHLSLRIIATNSSSWLLRLVEIPHFTSGTIIEIPNGTLHVADACSGFSTLYATVTVAIMTAYFCPIFKRKLLIILIAVPLAITVNIIRVFILTLLVHWMGLDILATSAHEISGLLTFAVALPVIFWLGQTPIQK